MALVIVQAFLVATLGQPAQHRFLPGVTRFAVQMFHAPGFGFQLVVQFLGILLYLSPSRALYSFAVCRGNLNPPDVFAFVD